MVIVTVFAKEIGTNKQIAQPASFAPPVDYSAIPIIGVQTPTDIKNYRFHFWTINNTTFQIDPQLKISAQIDVTATAWYTTGGPSPGTHAFGWAFSLSTGDFLTGETPFKTVNPPDGWTPTKYVVETTNHSVDITAKLSIQNQGFREWFSLNPGVTIINGSVVTVKAAHTVFLIAKYEAGFMVIEPIDLRKYPPIWGEETLGFQAMKWLFSEGVTNLIRDLIREFGLEQINEAERKKYSTKTITDFRCAIDAPHLHLDGKTYLLSQDQWKIVSNRIQKELDKELANAQSISFDKAVQLSKAMKSRK